MLIAILQERLSTPEVKNTISEMPHVASFLFGWRELSGDEDPSAWVAEKSESDEGFLRILNQLRSWAMSDRVYYPLHRSSIEAFYDLEDALARLEALEGGEHDELVKEIKLAMEQARH